MIYLFLITSIFLIAASLTLLYLPKDTLKYIINLLANIFKKGQLQDTNKDIYILYRSLRLIFILGVGSFIMALAVSYLNYIDTQRNLPDRKKYKDLNELFNLRDAIVLIYLGLFISLITPVMTYALRWDEALTMTIVNGPWLNILSQDLLNNNHMLSTICVKICVSILGEKEWVIRLPALISTLISVVGIYYLTKCITRDYVSANITTLLAITSFGFVFCATNARGYAFVITIAILMSLLIALQEFISESLWIKLYIISGVIGIITLPTAAIIPFGVMVAYLINSLFNKEENSKLILTVVKGMILILFISSIIYAWSFPRRLMHVASLQANTKDIIHFTFVNIMSAWGGLYENYYSGMIITIVFMVGIIILYFSNRVLAMYLAIITVLAVIFHIKGGYNAFYYSAIGTASVSFLIGISLNKIGEIGFIRSKPRVARALICLLALIIMIGNCRSDSILLGKRSYVKEIANIIKKYQDSSRIEVAVISYNNKLFDESINYYFRKDNIEYSLYYNITLIESPESAIIIGSELPSMATEQIGKERSIEFKRRSVSFTVVMDPKRRNLFRELNELALK